MLHQGTIIVVLALGSVFISFLARLLVWTKHGQSINNRRVGKPLNHAKSRLLLQTYIQPGTQ